MIRRTNLLKTNQICLVLFFFVLDLAPPLGGWRQNLAKVLRPGLPNVATDLQPSREAAQIKLGEIPLFFIPNSGQLDKEVDFNIQGQDKTLYFTSEGLTFSLKGPAQRWTVKLDCVGARKGLRPVGLEKTRALVSYFRGEPREWQTNLPTFSKIVYRDVWPGIDLVYACAKNRLKYEFIIHPGADPSLIRLTYRGATALNIDRSGGLEVTTPAGQLQDDAPIAYQESDGQKMIVPARYELAGKQIGKNDHRQLSFEAAPDSLAYRFRIRKYDRAKPLILAPAVLVFGGYIGGSDADLARDVAVDSAGNAYVVGETLSSELTFPVTTGPDVSYNGTKDVFVAKVSSDGKSLIYCGYIGGSGDEAAYSIAVDTDGNAYVGGSTNSDERTFSLGIGPGLAYPGG